MICFNINQDYNAFSIIITLLVNLIANICNLIVHYQRYAWQAASGASLHIFCATTAKIISKSRWVIFIIAEVELLSWNQLRKQRNSWARWCGLLLNTGHSMWWEFWEQELFAACVTFQFFFVFFAKFNYKVECSAPRNGWEKVEKVSNLKIFQSAYLAWSLKCFEILLRFY